MSKVTTFEEANRVLANICLFMESPTGRRVLQGPGAAGVEEFEQAIEGIKNVGAFVLDKITDAKPQDSTLRPLTIHIPQGCRGKLEMCGSNLILDIE